MSAPYSQAARDRLVCWSLFFAGFVVLLATQSSVGFVRDESTYFAAGESYAHWFERLLQNPSVALTDAAIVQAFDFNHEHPALMKTLFGLSYLLFHQRLGWLKPMTALRLPACAVAAIIPVLIYLLGKSIYGRKAALFGAISFFLVPRQFFNAHLACFDMPIAAFWLLTVYTFWRALHEPRYWLWCGVSFGLALATKHNGWFLPWVLAPFALWRAWHVTADSAEARRWLLRLAALYAVAGALAAVLFVALGPDRFWTQLLALSPHVAILAVLAAGTGWVLLRLRSVHADGFRALATLAAMAVIGPSIFYLHWPYLWHEPIERIAWYFAFHAKHNHYAWFYLGRLMREPPFPLDYVVVKTALTVPTSLFLPMVLGLSSLGARAVLALFPGSRLSLPHWGEALIAANGLASIIIISHPDVPHFGGVKHWLPSMPFLAILAGYSVARASALLAGWMQSRWPSMREWAVSVPLFSLLFVPALIATARNHPYGTSYYSELAGGLPGAATIGMQRQFWSNNVTGVLPWINENAPRNARLWLHEVTGFSFRDYQRNGMLRLDIRPANGPEGADIVAYQYHQEFREQEMSTWQAFGTQKPVTGLYLDETPQVVVYQRP